MVEPLPSNVRSRWPGAPYNTLADVLPATRCSRCKGGGWEPTSRYEPSPCDWCGGVGLEGPPTTLLDRLRLVYPEGTELPAWALWALYVAGEVRPEALDSPAFRERLFGAARATMVRSGGKVVPGHEITTMCEAWLHETCIATGGTPLDCQCRCHWRRTRSQWRNDRRLIRMLRTAIPEARTNPAVPEAPTRAQWLAMIEEAKARA